ncbi:MAG: twin-arginine translocase subunit TatC [Sulfuricaulis sp.]
MAQPENPDAAEGGLMSHLLELRNRLLYSVIAIAVVFFAMLLFVGTGEVYTLVAKPLMSVLPAGASMIATEVASPFLTPVKLTLAMAVVLTIPFLLYQLWAFVAPGLYRHERRLVMPLLLSSTLLFYGGMAFAYFVVFPMAFGFFVHALPPGVTMMTDIRAYLDFVFSMFFAFGIAFEVPVAVVLLARMGIINPDTLAQKRPYMILMAFVVAAVLTPPDVFSQFFLAVPMILLYEIGVFFARRMKRAADAAVDSGRRNLTETEIEAEFRTRGKASGKKG